ncbi:metalloregulator ArsR/SmtB family transcription factor [Rhodoferax sp.]|uniref:ArsR/SmtB family transcription factor n=1 Tax=Rhodoferax sp. TaxID=50421 RepID=UPI002ACEB70D|nr:metalloregulator ArsR/SmtB family transcription factor [Rhodoferax sp.]MDZ7920577.1 metalloregulator ArsR/SmtB family transcription factor [Rhodoferax sp.]
MNEQDVVRALAALAQQSRLQIFRQLVVAGPGGMTPTRLSEALGISATALSFHLKELTNANLITQERDGRNLIYRAAFATMNELLGFLTANCCEGQACEVAEDTVVCTTC